MLFYPHPEFPEYASTTLLFPDSTAIKGLERKMNIGFSI
jgi:hypothetical protein